jgi:hypothetical protein
MHRSRFVSWIALVGAGFLVLTLLYQPLVRFLFSGVKCYSGSCGGVAFLLTLLKPAGLLASAVILMVALSRRLRFLGLRLWWAVAALVWLLCNTSQLLRMGWDLRGGFLAGAGRPSSALFLIAFLVFVALLDDHPAARETEPARKSWIVAGVAAGLAAFLLLPEALLSVWDFAPGMRDSLLQTAFALRRVTALAGLGVLHPAWLVWTALLVFCAALAIIVAEQTRTSGPGLGASHRPVTRRPQDGGFGRRSSSR